MTISIIIPVYNVLHYLKRCLDSVVNQTMTDLEIIIIDDGSTDGSAVFVDEYAINDPRINVIHKENGGLMSAWTTGVRASHGDYIGFMDADDYALPEMYERLFILSVENDADIVMSNFLINGTDKTKLPITPKLYVGNDLTEKIHKHVFPSPNTYSMSMSRVNKLFRRNIIVDNLKYTESLSRTFEDRYIVPAAILSAKSVYYTDDAYYCWILRDGSNHGMYKKHLLDEIKRVYNVQYQVVLDKMPSLKRYWEEAFLDFIRLYVERNIIRVQKLWTKRKSAKVLLDDELTKDRLNKYGHLMQAKLGKAVNLANNLHSPILLALASYLTEVKG